MERSAGGRFARKEGQTQFGASGEMAEMLFPRGRPAAAAQVLHTDAFDRVTDDAQIERRRGRTLFAMDAKRIG